MTNTLQNSKDIILLRYNWRRKVSKFCTNDQLKTIIAKIVVDITSQESYVEASFWMDLLKTNCSDSIIIHICRNNSDLQNQRVVDNKQARHFGSKQDI
jgi:GTPase SAR1 family protein